MLNIITIILYMLLLLEYYNSSSSAFVYYILCKIFIFLYFSHNLCRGISPIQHLFNDITDLYRNLA